MENEFAVELEHGRFPREDPSQPLAFALLYSSTTLIELLLLRIASLKNYRAPLSEAVRHLT